MKKSFLLITGILFLTAIFSCNQDKDEINPDNGPADSTAVDSSALPHNMAWNGHYYQLEFDTAFARITGTTAGIAAGTEGCGPSKIMFESRYKDVYTGRTFILFMGGGPSMYGDGSAGHLYYYTSEVQAKLVHPGILTGFTYSAWSFGTGTMFRADNKYGPGIFPQYQGSDYVDNIELVSCSITFEGQDKIANYVLRVTRPGVEIELHGKFRAQYYPGVEVFG